MNHIAAAGSDQRITLCRRRHRQKGVTAIEYALIAALIAIVIVGAVSLTGENLRNLYDSSTSKILNAIQDALP